jgi:hypothetical protein
MPRSASPVVSKWCQKALAQTRGFLIFPRFAGVSGVRLEGFEPPTRGLGMRLHRFHAILVCQQIPLIYSVFRRSTWDVMPLYSAPF